MRETRQKEGWMMGNQSINKFRLSLFAVSVLLGVMLTTQMTSNKKEPNFGGADIITVKNALAYESKHHEQLLEQIHEMERKIQEYQGAAGSRDDVLKKMNEDLNKAKVEAGLIPLEGNGIRIEIKDAPALFGIAPSSHIWDYELQFLINLLKANGAQAVSFNGQRIVTTTGIREVGVQMQGDTVIPGIMQVNFTPVTMPYVVEAIGDVDKMKGAVTTYMGKDFFRIEKGKDLVITEFRDGNKLRLPAYTGSVHYQHAKEDKAEGAGK